MKLIKYDTFFNDPWTDMDRIFEQSFPELYQWGPARLGWSTRSLALDAYETDQERIIRVEVPGVNKEDIELEIENAVLSISAKRKEGANGKERTVELSRSVTVGDEVEMENIRANLENGVLTIHLPKRETARTRQITIE